ncbi:helix-turn-helix domain-containing protein [Rhodococcus sp. 2G]|uniref:helix-turn-helix domain-containing protein n=2 Tax=Rhodococcus TaxID=1827 RepID=UPI0009FB2240|nr:helix-turn-helix transcriptional regulator [Rhodococcus sp. 2G]
MGKGDTFSGMNRDQSRQESVSHLPMDEAARAQWASKIRPARMAKHLTQEELAELSGVARRTIGNIESGRMIPQAANLRKLMIALDLGPEPEESYPEFVREWIAVIAPLIQAIPQPPRNAVMTEVVMLLGNAAGGVGKVHALKPRMQAPTLDDLEGEEYVAYTKRDDERGDDDATDHDYIP